MFENFNSWRESLTNLIQELLFVSFVGGLLVVLVALLHVCLRRKLSPGFLYLLWALVVLRFVLFAVPESPTSFLNCFAVSSVARAPADTATDAIGLPIGFWDSSPETFQSIASSEGSLVKARHEAALDFWIWFGGIWIVVVAILWFRMLRGYLSVRRIVGAASSPSQELQSEFDRLSRLIGSSRCVELKITEDLDLPAMVGFIRPKVLLPLWCQEELSPQQLEFVMTHELIHIQRRDGIVQLLCHIVATLHWFNPMVRMACRGVASCRELSCDRRVVTRLSTSNPSKTARFYGQTILDIAERTNGQRKLHSAFLGGFLGNNENLIGERIAMLVKSNSSRRWTVCLGSVCVLLVLSVGFTAAQTTAAPQEPQETVGLSEKELLTEVQMTLGHPVGLMVGGQDVVDRFLVENAGVCEVDHWDGQVWLVGLGAGNTKMGYTDENGVTHKYEVDVLGKRPIKMVLGSLQRLSFENPVPELRIDRPGVIDVRPLSAREIEIKAKAKGESDLHVVFSDGSEIQETILVGAGPDELNGELSKAFPESNAKLISANTHLVLAGKSDKRTANEMASFLEGKTPLDIVDRTQVGDEKMVAIKMEIFEVNKRKLQEVGIDLSAFTEKEVVSLADLLGENQISDSGNSISLSLCAKGDKRLRELVGELEKRFVATLLDQPTLVASDQKAADFISGGEVPIPQINEFGERTIQFRPFGTIAQLQPRFDENGQLTMGLRVEFSELRNELADANGVPGFRVRRLNTGLEMELDQTIAIVGDYQRERANEDCETLILVTPRLIENAGMDK